MFVVIDLETTWLSSREDEIIEIACIKIERETFKELDRYHCFVKPDKPIPSLISQITNIFDRDVEDSKSFEEIAGEVEDFIDGLPIVGHNISFDVGFLRENNIDVTNIPTIDTFFLANFLCFEEKSLNLWYLCESFGIKLENAHRAIDDTIATVKVFQHLIGLLKSTSETEKSCAHYVFSKTQDSWVRILRDEYLVGVKSTKEEEICWYIEKNIRKNVSDISDMYSSEKPSHNYDFLSKIPWFESRESQKIMMDKVDMTLSKWNKLLIEAPTGIWKTFAYLLPAIKHSLAFHEPVHISTSTKALQDQIYFKDLNYISEHYPEKFSYTKLKWKRNYFSISSFLGFLDQSKNFTFMWGSFTLKMLFWTRKTRDWELDELDFYGEEYTYLSEIHAGNSWVLHESNPHRDLEYAYLARKRAKNSNIIITNNHILFSDSVSEGSLLWGVKNLIIDEAHSIEDVVTQALKQSLSYSFLEKVFQKLTQKIEQHKVSSDNYVQIREQILFDGAEILSLIESRIFEKVSFHQRYKSILFSGEDFIESSRYSILARKMLWLCVELLSFLSEIHEDTAIFFSSEIQQIEWITQFLSKVFISPNSDEYIYYATHDENYGTQMFVTLLSPGNFLKNTLWQNLESVVLTSATLQMRDNFSYVKRVLSLENFDSYELHSDFDYSKNALLYIPNDLWNIKNNLEEVKIFLWHLFLAVWGNMLVLFTAFANIKEVFTMHKSSLGQQWVSLLAQSISGSKHKQIDFFKKHSDSSILLGTDSLWEGIDIPGKDLQYLVIHKIPFSVPNDPIFMARSKLYKDSFMEYAVPKSVLKLKQGFWRLIRTKTDTGVIIFLDDRILHSKWGAIFYEAFPKDIKVRSWKTSHLLKILEESK